MSRGAPPKRKFLGIHSPDMQFQDVGWSGERNLDKAMTLAGVHPTGGWRANILSSTADSGHWVPYDVCMCVWGDILSQAKLAQVCSIENKHLQGNLEHPVWIGLFQGSSCSKAPFSLPGIRGDPF